MPWSAKDADKHKKGLSDAQKRQWAKVANSALKDGDSEGSAIRQANSVTSKKTTATKKSSKKKSSKKK